jgi:hypothetical protein
MARTITAAFFLSLLCAAPSWADPVLDFTGGSRDIVLFDGEVGWEFTVNSAITVDGLGYFDFDTNGLLASHVVTLWTLGGTPLASATVTSASTLVASTSTFGDWLFESIAPLTLAPGSYVIGASQPISTDNDALFATAVTIPEVTYVRSRLGVGLGSFPSILDGAEDGRFGPNLRTGAAVPTPEPSLLALFATGLAMVGLARSRRRRRG